MCKWWSSGRRLTWSSDETLWLMLHHDLRSGCLLLGYLLRLHHVRLCRRDTVPLRLLRIF